MDIKNIFGKVQELRNFRADNDDDDILDSAVNNDDYEDIGRPNKFSSGIFDDEEETPITPLSSFSYSPTAALPDFDSDKADFTPLKSFEEVAAPTASSNIYNMNATKSRSGSKFKLTFISLHDIYDAKNVANLMMDKNTIVVVNLSLLSEDQSKRAMDFLDGAKYVTKSVFARFTESICAFIPSDIELHGDFYNQVEL
jgi:FtsZ-interacting cell division protein YlmF